MKIIKFYADYCWPCKKYAPIIEQFCIDKWIELVSIDIEKNKEMTRKYNVSSIPTTVFIKDWKETILRWILNEDMLESTLSVL